MMSNRSSSTAMLTTRFFRKENPTMVEVGPLLPHIDPYPNDTVFNYFTGFSPHRFKSG